MNDQMAIELINRSLSEPLNEQESADLERYLAGAPQSQQYLQLSRLIQRTLVERSSEMQTTEMETGPGLSQIARNRIANRLASEIAARRLDSASEFRQVAEDKTEYQIRPDGSNDLSEQ